MKIGIYGYGNLAKGVEAAAEYADDCSVVGIFTRRDPDTVKSLTGVNVYSANDILNFKNEIDVLVICGGSATDLPEMTPTLAENFSVVDSFDTHSNIPIHFANVDKKAKLAGKLALICAGWDPGMFSLMRTYASSILPNGRDYTFWGKGVSQGHSDAARRIEGVLDARQYTVPVQSAIDKVKNGEEPEFTARDKHTREVFVVAQEDADKARIEKEITEMPNYYSDYNTTVHFISAEEMKEKHSALPHGGTVIRSGKTGLNGENKHTVEFNLKLDSNPEFTGSVLLASARAVDRMYKRGIRGCITMLDIAPSDLSALSGEELRKCLL